MADFQPFRGLLPNLQVVGQLSNFICPPYDVISPRLQRNLYSRSPYNMVRVEEGEMLSSDTTDDNRYTRAAQSLRAWLGNGALVRDPEPAYYLVRHGFPSNGDLRHRMGLIGAVRLEEYAKGVVLPHEFTQKAAKEDRRALMESCRCNVSQIMLLYRDSERRLAGLYQQVMATPPVFSFPDSDGQTYDLWRIVDPSQRKLLRSTLADKPLYMADGHHRYETALAYRKAHASQGLTNNAALNFVMAYLVDFEDPGLAVLPYHRVVKGLDPKSLDKLWSRLEGVFTKEPASQNSNSSPEGLLDEVEKRGKETLSLGALAPARGGGYLLTLRPEAAPKGLGPKALFEAWLLEELILRPVLGDSLDHHVDWVHDLKEVGESLARGDGQVAFILKPLPMDLFETIVSRGERLPRKSTFFYHKLPTGLTINSLEGNL